MRFLAPFVLILISFILVGCATVGTKIDQDKLSQIKEGITTKQEVINLLGKPYMVTLTSDGKTMFMYQYVKASNRAVNFVPVVDLFAGGMDMNQQMLQVLIGKDDKVEKYIFNDNTTPINSGLLNQK